MLLTIRSASFDDLPVILALEQRAASAAHWSAEGYERLAKTGLLLVAERAGQVAGFVCAEAAVGEWEIENVVVADEFLRQGIASRLLCALIEQIEQGTGSRILLEVRESNHPARRLYEKHGFQEIGSRRNYYNHPCEDAILCERRSKAEKST